MAVDLSLLIVDGRMGPTDGFAHTMIEYGRDYRLFEELEKREREIPGGFSLNSYVATIPYGPLKGESTYGHVKQTPYGKPLKYVTAAEFRECAERYPPAHHHVWGRAAVAYIRELDPQTLVALYWH